MLPPAAAAISVRATLDMLDGTKREVADGVANDQYVFWLGSGISRERMPDLREAAKCVLVTLQSLINPADGSCRFRSALERVLALANPTDVERQRIDYNNAADTWPDFESFAARLVTNYARMLNITVDGEKPDYLLWNVIGVAKVYSDPTIEPDAEHLCLAALAIEGVASEMPTVNWDPLIERAFALLAGEQPVLRVVVAPRDLRCHRLRANLYKFHGCAQAALDDEAQFRDLLVARQSQIAGWTARNPVIGPFLTNLIVTKRTLMLGLSAQDSNIQGLFAAAQAAMEWPWPSHPPACAISENALGGDQESLLENVYHRDFSPANRSSIATEALIQAYAKPLLLSLFLYVVTSKLQVLVGIGSRGIAAVDSDKLHEGLEYVRNLVADALTPSAPIVIELLQHCGRAVAMLRDGSLPSSASGIYSPITAEPRHSMAANPELPGSGVCQFAVAVGLIGLGLKRGLWTADKADITDPACGAFVLTGRSGPAKVCFASNARAAIRLGTNGLIADNGDTVIVHSHGILPAMPRHPSRPPGRTGLAPTRGVGMEELLADGTEVEDLLDRFRNKVAL